jgi:hypothetical protein
MILYLRNIFLQKGLTQSYAWRLLALLPQALRLEHDADHFISYEKEVSEEFILLHSCTFQAWCYTQIKLTAININRVV